MNWRELRDAINTLPEEQLDKQVTVLIKDETWEAETFETLKEDVWIVDGETDLDSCFLRSEITEEEFIERIKTASVAAFKGTPYICC